MSQAALAPVSQAETSTEDSPAYDLIELFFFAYRDFVGDPDRILDDYGFGRAHHRVMHFVARRPGLAIADLLEVLRITKQSLSRVLKELVDKGFVEQRTGLSDRRQRLLYATPVGHELVERLATVQSRRIALAIERAGPEAERTALRFLPAMMDPSEPERVRPAISAVEPAE